MHCIVTSIYPSSFVLGWQVADDCSWQSSTLIVDCADWADAGNHQSAGGFLVTNRAANEPSKLDKSWKRTSAKFEVSQSQRRDTWVG